MAEITRKSILAEAERCVCADRESDYGNPEANFSIIAALWEPYIQAKCVGEGAEVLILPEDVAILMALLKIGRMASGRDKLDNYVDGAGYLACAGEIALGED